MAMSDLLYSGNPAKRERLIMLHQELIDCIELCFDATNHLIEVLNANWQCRLSPIKMKKKGTIRENCDIFDKAIKSIQDVLQDIDRTLSIKLEPDLYQKLRDFHEIDPMKMSFALKGGEMVIGTVASGIMIKQLFSKIAASSLSEIATIMARIGVFVISLVAGAAVVLGLDLIVSAIMGARERKKLDAAIQELEPLVNEFKPASKQYYRNAVEIEIRLRCGRE